MVAVPLVILLTRYLLGLRLRAWLALRVAHCCHRIIDQAVEPPPLFPPEIPVLFTTESLVMLRRLIVSSLQGIRTPTVLSLFPDTALDD